MNANRLTKERFKRFLREKKGMTLVELIVAIAISVIVIGLSGGYLISSLNLFGHVADKDLDASIADTALSFITDELQFASAVTPITDLDGTTANTILYVADKTSKNPTNGSGILMFHRAGDSEAINLYGDSFYHGKTVGIQYEVNLVSGSTKAVTVTVDVYDAQGNKAISRSKSLRLLNAADDTEPLAAAAALPVSILKIVLPTS
ncbi:MAG: type II secretion system GspH family protein [Clostridiales Family XIII bacterium]|nr:type II secretion system GspH family protein [Clostridiales Family XIII bacterium]